MSWILIIAGLFVVLLLMGCFNMKEKKPPKVNIHGVKYKTEDFGSESKTVAFYDSNKGDWVWIEELEYLYPLPNRRPCIRRGWFDFTNSQLESLLDSVTSIDVVYRRNKKVREDYDRALEHHNNYVDKVNKLRNKY